MLDMLQLLPHSKKDSKLDTKADRGIINEVAEMKVLHRNQALVHHYAIESSIQQNPTDRSKNHAGVRQCHVF